MNDATSAGAARSASLVEPGNGVVRKPGVLQPATQRETAIHRAQILWEHRRILLRTFVCGALVSAVIALCLPSNYEATAELMPPDPSAAGRSAMLALSGSNGGFLSGLASSALGITSNGPVFVAILQSRTVTDRLIENFQLSRMYHTRKIEYTRKQLEAHSKILEDRKNGVITITVTDHDPRRAAAMAQAYVAELDRLVSELSTSSARRERVFLEQRLKTVKSDLDAAAVQFSEFASRNTAIDIPAQGKAMVEAAAVLQGQLIASEAEASGLEKIYTVNNIRVKALQARISKLRQQLQKLGGSDSTDELKSDTSLYPSIRKLPLLGVTYADLFRRTKIQETVFELLTQQYELAKVQEAKEIPSVKVIDAPVVPTVKSSPHRRLLTAAGTVFAVWLAAWWILLRSRWSKREPDDPARVLAGEMTASVMASATKLACAASAMIRVDSRLAQLLLGRSQWYGKKPADAQAAVPHEPSCEAHFSTAESD